MAIKDLTQVNLHLFLCNGGTCSKKGADESTKRIREHITEEGLDMHVHTTKTLCNGRCNDGPIVIAMPEGKWFKNITPENTRQFVNEYVVQRKGCEHFELYTYGDSSMQVD